MVIVGIFDGGTPDGVIAIAPKLLLSAPHGLSYILVIRQ